MPRPTKPCARCTRHLLPNCEHLANTYDRAMLKGQTDQDLIEYALNRILALDRDNGNKAEGAPASRIYKSRNVKTSEALATRCGAWDHAVRRKCIRTPHPHEPEKHKW